MALPTQGTTIEQNSPIVQQQGLNTRKASNLAGVLVTAGGAVTFPVAPTFAGGQTRPVNINALVGATVVLTAADSGSVNINRSTSGTPSWTLPTNVAGLYYTFYVASTTAGFTVTGGTIKAKTSATGTAISGTTLTNTQATAVVGDTITLIADGTNWIAIAQSGVYAAT